MSVGGKKNTTEQTIFEILAHPIRRRILEEVHNRREVSYNYFAGQLGLQAGSLYHHLRVMRDLIEQGSNKKYRLTSKGVHAIELVHSSESALGSSQRTSSIPSFKVFNSLFRAFSEHPTRSFIEGTVVVLVFLWFMSKIEVVVFGPFLLDGSVLKSYEVVLIGFGSWILCAVALELLTRIAYGRQENVLALATSCLLIFVLPGFFGALLYLLTQLGRFEALRSDLFLFVEIGAQVGSILYLSSAISQLKHISREKATILALSVNYLLLIIMFALLNSNIIK